jgi:insertion element IS1 protein InsB
MWSFVKSKSNQRWLWLAIDHSNGVILAYTFGKRKDEVFKEFKKILKPFKISMFYSYNFGSYKKYLDSDEHKIGKANMQKMERKNLTIRTRAKRLARKSICFSKSEEMHDIVIGLVINVLEFGWLVDLS